MYALIRRFQKPLWAVIAGMVILSFVLYFNPASRGNRGGGGAPEGFYGTIGGRPITKSERVDAEREAELGYFLQNGTWSDDRAARQNFNRPREAYIRILKAEKAHQLGVHVSPEAVAEQARAILGGATPDKLEQAISPHQLTLEDFERYVRHELESAQLFSVIGLSGKLVTPAEAEELYRKEHQDLSVSVASFSASNNLAAITVTPDMVASYYSNAQANYSIPKKRIVAYVKWDVTNYMAEAVAQLTNVADANYVNAQVDKYFRNGTNGFYKSMKTEAEAKAKLREDIIKDRALLSARRAAGKFANDLDAEKHVYASFENLARTNGLAIRTTEPFDQADGPAEITGSTKFVTSAFTRTPDEPFSGAVDGEDGFYVLAFKTEIPSRIPALSEVESKVTADYKLSQASQKARITGTMFATMLTNGLAMGSTFESIAVQAKAPVQNLPPFSLDTREAPPELDRDINFQMIKQIAFSTPPGKASPFIPTAEGGVVVYVKAKLPVNEAKLKAELPNFINYVRQARRDEAINQWFNKEIEQDKGFADIFRSVSETPQMRSAARRSKS